MSAATRPAHASGTFTLGDLTVHRLGFGAMRITGEGIWGPPADHDEAIRVLRRAVDLGVDLIDTADSYGPEISEELIREALYPYPEVLVIATKAGLTRPAPRVWVPVGRAEYLKQQCELSLRRLGVERIDLFQLHRPDPKVPLAESVGALAELREEGKIRHIGVSNFSIEQIEEARAITEIVSVQNLYNLVKRDAEAELDYCDRHGLAFIPWNPIAIGELARPGGPLDDLARTKGVPPSQLALAWLLRRSPVTLPIPGTSRVSHLEDNLHAAQVELTDEEFDAMSSLRPAG
ncbi:aldo/keto reductase [Actinopolymorpha pittospori]|uniref:Aryl-alcohol dehydrogenase-like predicted oxidoreductase n=1 Tax=Actinopolymorpha pittospori TaxID=648752 RepID=A0A927RD20_9ACTN|nr:aldo/keto reductase [Actinopolymorpha pittospori]MBE1611882.1 aryl-alcohol dehydrogenase-like predicted oxidoreductase [Actinopolymorpha pittospori]